MGHRERARSQQLLEQGSLETSLGRWAGPGGRESWMSSQGSAVEGVCLDLNQPYLQEDNPEVLSRELLACFLNHWRHQRPHPPCRA